MNIFYVDKDPKLAAQSLGDKHVVKMILESAQMLSTAHNILNPNYPGPYKTTHVNHPSSIWVRSDRHHYGWLLRHFCSLLDEYTHRYGKTHKCREHLNWLLWFPQIMPAVGFIEPPLCMPDVYKIGDAVTSYREYYKVGKAHLHKYTKREKPEWL